MLRIENLTKSFGQTQVLNGLNLTVNKGSIFGLVGVNGAGKSTLLRLIAGVYEPDAGSVFFNKENTYLNEKARGDIVFVSDDQYYPIGSTISSMKCLYESLYNFDNEAYRKYLAMFELNEKSTILNLSKGNKRRVALLFALSIHPKLLLLDEAYDGLEPLVRLRFKKALAELIEDEELTVIISSHNLKELEDICDTYGILEDGKIMSYGDLLQTKASINKYQIAFKEEKTKKDFEKFDLLHYEKEGRVYKLVIRGENEEVRRQLLEMNPVLIDSLQVNFEELFIYELESRGTEHE